MKQIKKQKKPTFGEIITECWGHDEYSIYETVQDLCVQDYERYEGILEKFYFMEWSDDLEPKIIEALLEERTKEDIADISIKDEFETTEHNIGLWFRSEARRDLQKKLYTK